MFLRCTTRKKNGKEHRYWSIVENKRCAGGKVAQRHVLYLGEINDQQEAAWQKSIEVFEHGQPLPRTVALFPAQRQSETQAEEHIVRVRLSELQLRRPRQWGACWLATQLYQELGLDRFWAERLPPSRKSTRWDLILQTLCVYRLIDPGSEWRLHREWFERSALGDLLGADFAALAEAHKLYECHDLLLAHRQALFDHLTARWRDLFNARFDVLLYDLTSTYFESDPPFPEGDKRKHGYSRDKRPDCVQVVLALIVTPEGFPLAYEVMPGNTSDKTTLREFLAKIEQQYGKARRIWIMDRGIPTEDVLRQMRQSDPPVLYLVGMPKGRLTQLEQKLTQLPWQQAREGVEVKLLPEAGEVYVLAQSRDRVNKERAIRRRQQPVPRTRLREDHLPRGTTLDPGKDAQRPGGRIEDELGRDMVVYAVERQGPADFAPVRPPDGRAYQRAVARGGRVSSDEPFGLIQLPVRDQRGIVHLLPPAAHEDFQVVGINLAIAPGHGTHIHRGVILTPGFDESQKVLEVHLAVAVEVHDRHDRCLPEVQTTMPPGTGVGIFGEVEHTAVG